MWLFISFTFPIYCKKGRTEQAVLCRQLTKNGFTKIHNALYVRYCHTKSNAIVHKKKIISILPQKCDILIFLILDHQAREIFTHLKTRKSKKTTIFSLEPLPLIEFF